LHSGGFFFFFVTKNNELEELRNTLSLSLLPSHQSIRLGRGPADDDLVDGLFFIFASSRKGGKKENERKEVGQRSRGREREGWSSRPRPTETWNPKSEKTETLLKTYDEDQLDEEADESHDDEAERGLGGDLGELCCE
jgi:hypothetical protein